MALSDASFVVGTSRGDLTASHGTTPDMFGDYGPESQETIAANRLSADQDLVDYVMTTAGKHGAPPFNADR